MEAFGDPVRTTGEATAGAGNVEPQRGTDDESAETGDQDAKPSGGVANGEPAATSQPADSATEETPDEDCPPRTGNPIRCGVGFHEFPEGLEVGDEFACSHVRSVTQQIRGIGVDVWDENDFLARTEGDPNIRYVERSGGTYVELEERQQDLSAREG